MGAGLEAAELAVGPDEAFLHHVFGILFVAGHSIGQLKRPSAVPLDQRPERLAVALPGAGEYGGDLCRVHSGS